MPSEHVYARLPLPLQDVAVSAAGLHVNVRRYNADFRRLLGQAKERDTWSQDRIERFRDARLCRFIAHAVETVPYYRTLFGQLGLRPEHIRSLDDYVRLVPVLDKHTVQQHPSDFQSEAIPARTRRSAHTSGTTGAGLRFVSTWPAVREQWAVWWRYLAWHGIEPGTWCGYFFGRLVHPHHRADPPFWRVNQPGRQVLFSAYHMRPDLLDTYVEEIRRRRLPWLHGYPSTITLLAAHILERELELGYPLQAVTTASENLLPHQAALIGEAFGVMPRQHYAMTEAATNASECPLGRLHIDEDFAVTELVSDAATGVTRVVGSNVSNPAFPLLRYATHDLATLNDEPCPCGRPGRVLASVDGREEDYVQLADGTRLGRLDHIFKDMVRLREAQILQRRSGEIVVRIVPGPQFGDDDRRALMDEARRRLGHEIPIFIEDHETLPRTATRKLRLVVRER